jgi:hypothetical protein
MKHVALSPDQLRLRLVEGVLLRLAHQPSADDFVLRGGILLRHWFAPLPRPVADLDLVATFPFDLDEAARRFLPTLTETDIDDGVTFLPDRTRHEGIWLSTGTPGMRVFASGQIEGQEEDFHVDITFGPFPVPEPITAAVLTTQGAVSLRVCRPEAVAGHKVQALWHRGVFGWRAKDLYDLYLLLIRVPMVPVDLRASFAHYLADAGGTLEDLGPLFAPDSWWTMKMASARWHDFVQGGTSLQAPGNLTTVVAEVANRLAPILESER